MSMTPDHDTRHAAANGTIMITQARKQMLIDNLQLEITERARKLRAQYALQAQALRTRLEMRVNRIPHSLRSAKMQDLLDKHSQPQLATITSPHKPAMAWSSMSRGVKRSSDALPDKENSHAAGDLENPKKRTKTTMPMTALPPIQSSIRSPSRKADPASILSPKSHNSRTLPASPFKTTFPFKPSSPVKPSSPIRTSPAKDSALPKPAARAATTAAKPARPASRQVKPTSRPSTSSDASSGTTIVKRTTTTAAKTKTTSATAPTAATKSRAAAGIKSALSSLTGSKRSAATAAARKAAPAVAQATTTTVGGRTLRKRN